MTAETIRKTVPLTKDELDTLEAARVEGSAAYEALTELVGTGAGKSEAATLHAAMSLGVAAINERIQARGYAALAAAQDDEDRAYHAAMRRRPRGNED